MMHLAIGLGVIGFFLARRHRRHHYYRGAGPRCGPGPDRDEEGRGWHRRGPLAGRRFFLRHLFRELDASPAQERAILAELEGLEQRARTAAETLRGGKADLAVAIAGAQLDEEALKAATSRLDAASADLRDAGLGALRAIHALLDDGQRRRVAELMDRRPWWRSGGPYR
jgi:hypothetical protein